MLRARLLLGRPYRPQHGFRDLALAHDDLVGAQPAQVLDLGIVVRSGHLDAATSAADNIRFVLGTKGVTSMVFGSLQPENIVANARALCTKQA